MAPSGRGERTGGVIGAARALRLGGGGGARGVRGYHPASPPTQIVIFAAPARLGGVARARERAERVGPGPVRGELVGARAGAVVEGGGRRGEAARGELTARLGADQEVAAGAAVH